MSSHGESGVTFNFQNQAIILARWNCIIYSCIPSLVRLFCGNIFYLHPYLGKISILTNIFQRGWNHQLVCHCPLSELFWNEDGSHSWSALQTFCTGNETIPWFHSLPSFKYVVSKCLDPLPSFPECFTVSKLTAPHKLQYIGSLCHSIHVWYIYLHLP